MTFTVEQNGKIIESFARKEDLAIKVGRCSPEIVAAKEYQFFHVTATKRQEMTHGEICQWFTDKLAGDRAKKEETHKQVWVKTGVTGFVKKPVWVKH